MDSLRFRNQIYTENAAFGILLSESDLQSKSLSLYYTKMRSHFNVSAEKLHKGIKLTK